MKKGRINLKWFLLIILLCLALVLAIVAGTGLWKSAASAKKSSSEVEPTFEIQLVLPDSDTDETETVQTVSIDKSVGTFYSKTGTSLNIGIKWYLSASTNNSYDIYFDIYVNCKNLTINGKSNGIAITINGCTYYLDSKDINYSGNEATFMQIGEYTVTVPADSFNNGQLPVSISYSFGGTYGGQQIDTITADGSVKLVSEE